MSDYTPVALPGQTYTFSAGGTIAGGDPVEMSASSTVIKSVTLASALYIGVAGHDAVNGGKVTVTLGKVIHESIADGTITAGAQLTTTNTANRQVKALAVTAVNVDVTGTPSEATIEAIEPAFNTAINQARAIIGVAITAATDNTLVRWAQR